MCPPRHNDRALADARRQGDKLAGLSVLRGISIDYCYRKCLIGLLRFLNLKGKELRKEDEVLQCSYRLLWEDAHLRGLNRGFRC